MILVLQVRKPLYWYCSWVHLEAALLCPLPVIAVQVSSVLILCPLCLKNHLVTEGWIVSSHKAFLRLDRAHINQ